MPVDSIAPKQVRFVAPGGTSSCYAPAEEKPSKTPGYQSGAGISEVPATNMPADSRVADREAHRLRTLGNKLFRSDVPWPAIRDIRMLADTDSAIRPFVFFEGVKRKDAAYLVLHRGATDSNRILVDSGAIPGQIGLSLADEREKVVPLVQQFVAKAEANGDCQRVEAGQAALQAIHIHLERAAQCQAEYDFVIKNRFSDNWVDRIKAKIASHRYEAKYSPIRGVSEGGDTSVPAAPSQEAADRLRQRFAAPGGPARAFRDFIRDFEPVKVALDLSCTFGYVMKRKVIELTDRNGVTLKIPSNGDMNISIPDIYSPSWSDKAQVVPALQALERRLASSPVEGAHYLTRKARSIIHDFLTS